MLSRPVGLERRRFMLRRRLGAKTQILARVPFFAGASWPEQVRLAQATDIITADAGETLIRQGRTGHEFFVILEGTAEVRRDGSRETALGPGECFGELSLLDGGPRSASVVARTSMSLAVIDSRAFRGLLSEAPAFSRALFGQMAQRLRAADDRAHAV
jgi:CRP/FNR family transcriptional regulator, cyclic AMP receptor protein